MTNPLTGDLECWRAPQSPFLIHYSRLVLEQIRLAVVDAYYLVPRGGLEIGGVLLGKCRDRHVEVVDHEPIECEHAFGPSFSLSPRDEERLQDVLARIRGKSGGLEAVGWYHSHTRSEILLTETDLEIHNRYFPEEWQVALVVRPSTSQPTRAGFFFRELGGSIRASGSYQEFKLEPLRGGPSLLKAEGGAPAPSLPRLPLERPVPATNQRPLRERPTPLTPTANSRPPQERPPAADSTAALERVLAPTAVAKPLRESPAPLKAAAPPRERPPAPARDSPRGERPLSTAFETAPPLRPRPTTTIDSEPPPERVKAPTAVIRLPLERPAAPATDRQPKGGSPATLKADSQPLPGRPAATRYPNPEPVRRLDSGTQVIELPSFLRTQPPPSARWTRVPRIIGTVLVAVVALGTLALVAKEAVLASIGARPGRARTSTVSGQFRIGPAMSINAIDNQGQLQIRWDTGSQAVREARSAVLAIVDAGSAQRIPLDVPHLQAGAITYKRHGTRVDARLTILTAEASSVEAATTFLGAPPATDAEASVGSVGAAALARQNVQLRRELDEQIARTKSLQARLDWIRKQRTKKSGL
jgi:proteasome lid subunit RPN8/RPN11